MASNNNNTYNLRQKSKEKEEASEVSEAEEQVEEKERARNWSWDDSYEMLRIAAKEGKNWAKVLEILHSRHCCTDITDHSKLRVRYNTLNGKQSTLRKPWAPPKFTAPKNLAPDQKRKKEEEHAAKWESVRHERETALALIEQIEAREELATSAETPEEDQVRQKMKEKADERRSVRNERFKVYEKDAQEEKDYRSGIVSTLKDLFELYRESVKQEREILDELLHERKRHKNN